MNKQPLYETTGTIDATDEAKRLVPFYDRAGKRNQDLVVTGRYIRKNKPGHLNRADARKEATRARLEKKAELRKVAIKEARKAIIAERKAARAAKKAKP